MALLVILGLVVCCMLEELTISNRSGIGSPPSYPLRCAVRIQSLDHQGIRLTKIANRNRSYSKALLISGALSNYAMEFGCYLHPTDPRDYTFETSFRGTVYMYVVFFLFLKLQLPLL